MRASDVVSSAGVVVEKNGFCVVDSIVKYPEHHESVNVGRVVVVGCVLVHYGFVAEMRRVLWCNDV